LLDYSSYSQIGLRLLHQPLTMTLIYLNLAFTNVGYPFLSSNLLRRKQFYLS
jgi:hypothetical protein